eukprot:531653-Prorocentrum_lima.AAC.1
MSLTKAWRLKNFVHSHGTSLKSDPKVGTKDLKGKMKGISVKHIKASVPPEEDWSQCTKDQ